MKTSWFKTMAAACAVSLVSLGAFGAESITLATSNHYPWDGKVDCQTTLSGLESGETYYGVFTLTAGGETKVYTNEHLKADGTYTTSIDCTELFGSELCTTGAGITVKLYKKAQEKHEGVQLWKDGPWFATTNVGAKEPQDYGYYFWWGDTVGYTNNMAAAEKEQKWFSVKDGTEFEFDYNSCGTYNKTAQELFDEGWTDSSGNLVAAHDAATANWGSTWRMMTEAEANTLVSSTCTSTWTTDYKGTGVRGRIVKGNTTGYKDKEIFLPAAGYGQNNSIVFETSAGQFWASKPAASKTGAYYARYYQGNYFNVDSNWERSIGISIRPVSTTAPVATAGNDTEAASATGTFAVDTRETKTTTLAGAEIVGGETILTLNYSPTAWGAGIGTSVAVTYMNQNTGTSGTIVEGKTTAGSVDWTPPAEAGPYWMYHSSDDGTELITYFEVVVNTAEVVPVLPDNTDVEGVYTNGVPVEKTAEDQYIVKKGAEVEVKFIAATGKGYFFHIGENYLATYSEQAKAEEAQTFVECIDPEEGTSAGGTTYYFMDGGAMTLVGSGAATSLPAEISRDSITSVKIGDGITSIGEGYFLYCPYITTVTGGKDLTEKTGLGSQAFHLCMDLKTVTFDCTSDPGIAGAIKYNEYISSSGQLVTVPTVSYKGSVEVLYGKDKMEDAEWTKIGVLSVQPSMYEIEGFHFFQVRVEKEVK